MISTITVRTSSGLSRSTGEELCRLCRSGRACSKASPITYVDAKVAPLFVIASDHEAMPPEQYPDLIRKLESVGATNFQKLLRPNSQRARFCLLAGGERSMRSLS